MKLQYAALCLAAASLLVLQPVRAAEEDAGPRTITKVVKLLQDMLDKSKADGDSERNLYAKYKCYCDTNEADKKAEIEKLSEQIALLESEIEELQASTAQLSKEVAKLDADMKANKASQDEATQIRGKENEAYIALKDDLDKAIGQMKEAIKTLSEVGADQTLSTAADHKQYMAGYEGASLASLRSTVKQALLAAGAFVDKKQVSTVDAFLQAPFTGTYTAQSGQVVGILKDMLDTFEANLQAAITTEATQKAAYDKYIEEMEEAYKKMDGSYNKKQGELASNDGILSTKRDELDQAQKAKEAAEDFLAKLLDLCAEKRKQHEQRVELRMNEETALSEAISILNSDAAFATFGTVDATKTGATAAFVQLGASRRAAVRAHRSLVVQLQGHLQSFEASPKRAAQEFLQKAGGKASSPVVAKIAALLQANNPFATVLKEIEKMIGLLAAEGDKDTKHKDWCDGERKVTKDDIDVKKKDIISLTGDINALDEAIDNPETGLVVTIADKEDQLQKNYNNQVSETKERREENLEYQKDISNLVEAASLVERAVKVLTKYYSKISAEIKAELIQVHKKALKDEPAPPSTWDDTYKGQSEAGGTDAISMLEFILKNTKAEETQAHTDENAAQVSYEDSMQSLKTEEAGLQKSITNLKKELADKEEERLQKNKDLTKTEEEKAALEAYLEEIKPGCDFITENLELRTSHRANEKKALEDAVGLIQGTPAYQEFQAASHNETLGDCLAICTSDEDHVDCKACMSGVSVPGYCAGHPATLGC